MTVTELRQALEAIEAAGKGSMQVVYEDCICNDSDYDLEQRDVDTLTEEDGYASQEWKKKATGTKVLRLC